MKSITLLFPDARLLWSFAQTLQSNFIQINSTERKLTCHCSDADVSKAVLQYKAIIVDEVEQRNQQTV